MLEKDLSEFEIGEKELGILKWWAKEKKRFAVYDLLSFASIKVGQILPWAYWLKSDDSPENAMVAFGMALVSNWGASAFNFRKMDSSYKLSELEKQFPYLSDFE
jgi:hypothetical protein